MQACTQMQKVFSATTALLRGGSLIFFIIGDILRVVPRLEARYDWQPMPFRTLVKHEKTRLRYVHNPCHHAPKAKRIKTAFKEVALVSSDEDCSTFQKVYITMHAGIPIWNDVVKTIKIARVRTTGVVIQYLKSCKRTVRVLVFKCYKNPCFYT